MVLPELSSTEAVELIFSEKKDKKKEKKRVSPVQLHRNLERTARQTGYVVDNTKSRTTKDQNNYQLIQVV